MSNREKLPEFIDRYNNGELTGEDLRIFQELLKEHPRLSEEIKLDKELNAMLIDDLLDLRKKILSVQQQGNRGIHIDLRILLLAASLLFFFAIEGYLFYSKEKGLGPFRINGNGMAQRINKPAQKPYNTKNLVTGLPKHQGNPQQGDTTSGKQKLMEKYRENPAYENLVGASRYAENFRMIAPVKDRFTRTTSIFFKWSSEKDSRVSLAVLDNTGRIVRESGVIFDNIYSIPAGILKDGLYYFKVIHNDEIMFFGKFTVGK